MASRTIESNGAQINMGPLAVSGAAGESLALTLSGSTNTAMTATVTVLAPDGTTVASGAYAATSSSGGKQLGTAVIDMGPLPANGTYTILIRQSTVGEGTFTFNLAVTVAGTFTPTDMTPTKVVNARATPNTAFQRLDL